MRSLALFGSGRRLPHRHPPRLSPRDSTAPDDAYARTGHRSSRAATIRSSSRRSTTGSARAQRCAAPTARCCRRADASLSAQRQQGGQQIFSGTSLGASSDVNQSSYQIGFNYRINSATLITPSLQRANRDAVEADITGATRDLRSNVRSNICRRFRRKRTPISRTRWWSPRSRSSFSLRRERSSARAPSSTSSAPKSRSDSQKVQVLKARNQVEIEKLRLFQLMGVAQPANVKLVEPVSGDAARPRPANARSTSARNQNPVRPGAPLAGARRRAQRQARKGRILADAVALDGHRWLHLRLRELEFPGAAGGRRSSNVTKRAAFAPKKCAPRSTSRISSPQCNAMAFTDAQARGDSQTATRSSRSISPSRRARSARRCRCRCSTDLRASSGCRKRMANRSDARYDVRARELALTADVTAAYLTLKTAEKTAALQEQNAAKAKQELKLVAGPLQNRSGDVRRSDRRRARRTSAPRVTASTRFTTITRRSPRSRARSAIHSANRITKHEETHQVGSCRRDRSGDRDHRQSRAR